MPEINFITSCSKRSIKLTDEDPWMHVLFGVQEGLHEEVCGCCGEVASWPKKSRSEQLKVVCSWMIPSTRFGSQASQCRAIRTKKGHRKGRKASPQDWEGRCYRNTSSAIERWIWCGVLPQIDRSGGPAGAIIHCRSPKEDREASSRENSVQDEKSRLCSHGWYHSQWRNDHHRHRGKIDSSRPW